MAVACLAAGSARAQTPGPASTSVVLPTLTIAGSGDAPPPAAASEQTVTREQVLADPVARPAEILEAATGLIVTQHSGEGKANQYFLRGFNLDHGTDLAITVDGMPVNMRTHGHGQGYADINFLIPELVQSIRVRKGPYFADEGDFSSAGAIRIDYLDRMPKNVAEVTLGSFGYRRGLAAASAPVNGGTVLTAVEGNTYNGPWATPDDVRKINGVVRYSQGTASDGFSVTGMAYANRWNSTDQIAQRAVTSGLIDRFGTLDPTDGGDASRYSLSGRWSTSTDTSATKVEAYAIRAHMRLFNNFTYYLDDPVNGDQFSQSDDRSVLGLNASHTIKGRLGAFDTETMVGIQTRYDDIHVGLYNTVQRQITSTTRDDHVKEGSVGLYGQSMVRWTDWLRTVVGLRYDRYDGRVDSDTPENSGNAAAWIASPKASVIFGPFAGTELFLNAGRGFHSNDLRGATITVDPSDKVTPLLRVPLLVRSQGAEVGLRTRAIPNLESSIAVFVLDYASELLFVGDAGTTEPSRPSRRFGVEWTNHYQPLRWLGFDADLAYTRARFTDDDPAGNDIPGAPAAVASASVVVGYETGWFGTVKLRYFGPRPLVEDGSVRSGATTLVNARLGYKFDNGLRIQLDALNLFNSQASQIDYYYTSRLPGEPAAGVADVHFHPVEPFALRLTAAATF
ncbi:TonB-dependent receptor [Pseudolabrys taiwanensis]|uniref:TonB-dependent receptor n=1 Tax=Pseudolabrys taiwanensis TaxID=331696 RepID=A0A346A1Y7_9HYPH|nr:TonB-dependent receptor [Pseudolabrys taiwanensis]